MTSIVGLMLGSGAAGSGCIDPDELLGEHEDDDVDRELFVPTRPGRIMSGDLEYAVVFVQLEGIPNPPELTASDLSMAMGTPPGGLQAPGVPPVPFETVAEYYHEVSFHTVSLSHDVVGGVVQVAHPPEDYYPSTLPGPVLPGWGYGEGTNVAAAANDFLDAASAQVGLVPDDYDGVIFVVAGQAHPGWARWHDYNGHELAVVLIHGNWNTSNGAPLGEDAMGTYSTLKSLLIHEIGHAAGDLSHNGQLQCIGATVHEDLASECTLIGTLNPVSPMGSAAVRHFGAYEKRLMGFVGAGQTWVPGLGHYHQTTLASIEHAAPTQYQEIRIPLGPDEFYTVDYRKPWGIDAPPLSPGEAESFYNVSAGDPLQGLMITYHPPDGTVEDVELGHLTHLVRPGEPFHDNYRGVHVFLTQELKGDRAKVDVWTDVYTIEL